MKAGTVLEVPGVGGVSSRRLSSSENVGEEAESEMFSVIGGGDGGRSSVSIGCSPCGGWGRSRIRFSSARESMYDSSTELM